MSGEHQPNLWRRLAAAFGPDLWAHRRPLAAAYAFRLISAAAIVVTPWPLKVIIDDVLTARPSGPVRHFGAGMTSEAVVLLMSILFLAAAALGAMTNSLEKNISAGVRERFTLGLRERLLAHLQKLPPTFRTGNKSGELVLRLVDDTDLFARILTKTLPLFFHQISTLVLILAVMLWLDVRLAAFGLLLIPVLVLIIRHYSLKLWTASRDKRRYEGKTSGLAQEIVRGLPVLQALGSERHVRERFVKLNRKRLRSGVEETRLAVRMEQALQITQGVVLATIVSYGGFLVLRGQLTVGELTIFTTYVAQLLKPIEKLNDLSETAGRGFAGGERLLALLEERPLVEDSPQALPLRRARGMVELSDVWFAYPGAISREGFVLRGVNMRLEPGRLCVLLGPSGAGKSTIINLMMRLYDPSSGEVRLDGVRAPDLTIRSLRSQFAVMTQETHLFSGTLRRALSPDGVELNEKMIWEALALVALDDFVRDLPEGLETKLGEDALDLSGGQRQRLSLARAFLMDRPILLLDEPLANVDAASAAVILAALDRLRATHACLAITHQSELLDYADVVYQLEDGRIAEHSPEQIVNCGANQPIVLDERRMAS